MCSPFLLNLFFSPEHGQTESPEGFKAKADVSHMHHLFSKNSLSQRQKGLHSLLLSYHCLSILDFIANFHNLPLVNVTNLSLGSHVVLATTTAAGQVHMAWLSCCLVSMVF